MFLKDKKKTDSKSKPIDGRSSNRKERRRSRGETVSTKDRILSPVQKLFDPEESNFLSLGESASASAQRRSATPEPFSISSESPLFWEGDKGKVEKERETELRLTDHEKQEILIRNDSGVLRPNLQSIDEVKRKRGATGEPLPLYRGEVSSSCGSSCVGSEPTKSKKNIDKGREFGKGGSESSGSVIGLKTTPSPSANRRVSIGVAIGEDYRRRVIDLQQSRDDSEKMDILRSIRSASKGEELQLSEKEDKGVLTKKLSFQGGRRTSVAIIPPHTTIPQSSTFSSIPKIPGLSNLDQKTGMPVSGGRSPSDPPHLSSFLTPSSLNSVLTKQSTVRSPIRSPSQTTPSFKPAGGFSGMPSDTSIHQALEVLHQAGIFSYGDLVRLYSSSSPPPPPSSFSSPPISPHTLPSPRCVSPRSPSLSSSLGSVSDPLSNSQILENFRFFFFFYSFSFNLTKSI